MHAVGVGDVLIAAERQSGVRGGKRHPDVSDGDARIILHLRHGHARRRDERLWRQRRDAYHHVVRPRLGHVRDRGRDDGGSQRAVVGDVLDGDHAARRFRSPRREAHRRVNSRRGYVEDLDVSNVQRRVARAVLAVAPELHGRGGGSVVGGVNEKAGRPTGGGDARDERLDGAGERPVA